MNEPLWQAAHDGNVAQVKRLLDAGASASIWPEEAEGTPLMIAVYKGHTDVVRLLIQRGANVNQKANFVKNGKSLSDSYQSPLEAGQSQPEIVAILKQAGAH